MFYRSTCLALFVSLQSAAWAQQNPRHIDIEPGLTTVATLQQNWSDAESNQFYNAAQGSQLIPYDWFLNLEQADAEVPFRDAKNLRAMGYIPRLADPQNPDGLPIGFIQDAAYEDGTRGLGMTCAACHTSQINHDKTAFVIDGGPAMADLERFLKSLTASLQATADNDAKFARFAAKVLPPGASDAAKVALRAGLRSVAAQRAGYNERNLSKTSGKQFGPGRIDAFGAIFNEVSDTFLGIPENWHAADAPVSFPCLWDAAHHDRVQWNGAAENRVSPLGPTLFGTTDVGALGRNAGEVLGVFGSVDVNPHELLIPRSYSSTVNKAGLLKIENSLKALWSPEWPEKSFGAINVDLRDKGKVLFTNRCAGCHKSIDRTDPDRTVVAKLSYVDTDQKLNDNFGRVVKTGKLKTRLISLTGLQRFGTSAPVGAVLKHVVERAILDPSLTPLSIQQTIAVSENPAIGAEAIDALNPGYRMTATIDIGNDQLVGQFDSLATKEKSVTVGGGRFHRISKDHDIATHGLGNDIIDLRSLKGVQDAQKKLEGVVSLTESNEAPDPSKQEADATLENATAKIGYKARPLNGIWATAPYLHNGSVPNLAEMLKPAAQRSKTFHVGSREFDPTNVGFQDDAKQPLFDTAVPGNSNAGHEFAAGLTPDEQKELLEYLKSL